MSFGVRAERAGVDRLLTGRAGFGGGAEGTPAANVAAGSSPDTPFPIFLQKERALPKHPVGE